MRDDSKTMELTGIWNSDEKDEVTQKSIGKCVVPGKLVQGSTFVESKTAPGKSADHQTV